MNETPEDSGSSQGTDGQWYPPRTPAGPDAAGSRLAWIPTVLVVVLVALLAGMVGATWFGGEDDEQDAEPATTTTEVPDPDPEPAPTEPPPPPPPPPPPTVVTVPVPVPGPGPGPGPVFSFDVIAEPAGRFCRDLRNLGYDYADAVRYWEHHGRPSQMDRAGNGIPCETVYSTAEVSNYWAQILEPGLNCRAIADRNFGTEVALRYYIREGYPERMDRAGNGVPCETVFPDAAAVWARLS